MEIAMIVGAVPPMLLLAYVWYLDREEHEPIGLVAGVCVGSALLGTAAASFIETAGGLVLDLTLVSRIPVVGSLVYYFLVVALVEEFCKRLPVMALVWGSPEFDYRFDAIVYCVASAIGFAVAENIMYIAAFGGDVALGRLIPVHTICGVFMGYYLGCAKICERGGNDAARRGYLRRSLLIPMAIHGAWDFCVSSGSAALDLAALAGIVALTVYAWRRLRVYAEYDAPL